MKVQCHHDPGSSLPGSWLLVRVTSVISPIKLRVIGTLILQQWRIGIASKQCTPWHALNLCTMVHRLCVSDQWIQILELLLSLHFATSSRSYLVQYGLIHVYEFLNQGKCCIPSLFNFLKRDIWQPERKLSSYGLMLLLRKTWFSFSPSRVTAHNCLQLQVQGSHALWESAHTWCTCTHPHK